MIIPMPYIYEFQIDGKPVCRINLPFPLSNNDMTGIKLVIANREGSSVDRVFHMFEMANLNG